MIRRLIASLMVVACLLGVVQPVFACASRTDCCAAGSSEGCGEQMRLASAWIEANGCCASRAAITSSESIAARPHQGPKRASGLPAAANLPAVVPVAQHFAVPTPPALTAYRVNESLTYLRTARLRL